VNCANIIRVNFAAKAPVSSEITAQVAALAEVAAGALAEHVGRAIFVARERTSAATRVDDTYRLIITVGNYSTLRRRPLDDDIREWQARRDAAPREILVDVVADVEWLLGVADATSGEFGSEHAFVELSNVEQAAAWVRAHCRRASVARVPPEELAEWGSRTVTVRDGARVRRRVRISLVDAVRIYGPIYGREISASNLVAAHQLSQRDARAVAEAVLKIVPGGKR
jgi:hypothetical protein